MLLFVFWAVPPSNSTLGNESSTPLLGRNNSFLCWLANTLCISVNFLSALFSLMCP